MREGRGRPVFRRAMPTALGLALLAPTTIAAQGLGSGALFQTYRFDEPTIAGIESVRLMTIPFAVSAELGSRVSIAVSGAYASGSATGTSGEESTISGLTDTEVSVSVSPGPEWLRISASSSLPTGKSALSTEEAFVAAFVAAELLPFAINTWGTGGSAGGDVAVATQAGAWGLGFSAGYRLSQEYEPVPDFPQAYRPGDQLQLRLALDRNVSESSTFSLLLGVQNFGDDQLAGANLFKSGMRLQAIASLAFPIGMRSSAIFYGGINHRANGTVLTDEPALGGATDSPSQQLFMGGTNLRIPLGRGSAVIPKAELLVFRADDGVSQGWVATGGPAFELRVSGNSSTRQVFLAPSAVARMGNVIVEEGAESGFFGWEAGLTLRIVPGR